jgi:hypothetical protein
MEYLDGLLLTGAVLCADAVSEAPTEEEVVDRQIGDYCSINKEDKKSLGEMEQDFLAALQSFYFDKEPIMSNEEFDNLKEELQWQGSRVVILSKCRSTCPCIDFHRDTCHPCFSWFFKNQHKQHAFSCKFA